MRIPVSKDPYHKAPDLKPGSGWKWIQAGVWPCQWIGPPQTFQRPVVLAFRRRFVAPRDIQLTCHVSADERYELYLDGKRVGRGSERGDLDSWYFESYRFRLKKGPHVLVARVWALGDQAPFAQMSLRPGFILGTQEEWLDLVATGRASWQVKELGGYRFTKNPIAWGSGSNLDLDGSAFSWGIEKGLGKGWVEALSRAGDEGCDGIRRNETPPTRRMRPAVLPAMMEARREVPTDSGWPLRIPAHSSFEKLIDLKDYYCAYPELRVSGGKGSVIECAWAESLFNEPEARTKGNRNQVAGKYFVGVGDVFRPDGGKNRLFETLWWQAGRYLRLKGKTGSQALLIHDLALRETRYPLSMQSRFRSSDPRLERFIPIGLRGLQMCSHETFMDCPYYEQLMYVGDSRLEALTTYALAQDARLPRKAIQLYDISRLPSGLTQSRYPSHVTQVIPPFSLWWIGMVYDYALWRGDGELLRSLIPGVRAVLGAFQGFMDAEGLVRGPEGWNFMDWVPSWDAGVPQDGAHGVSALINWQMVGALEQASQLEDWLGEKELAIRNRRLASELAARLVKRFWVPKRGLFSDGLDRKHFSEHTQCLALLSGHLPAAKRSALAKQLCEADGLDRSTIYFSHYLFEAYGLLGRPDLLLKRLELWFGHESLGLKTTLEAPEPSRSDCHGWGSHPLHHYFATLLGIRPASFGFGSVRIRPQLGRLQNIEGSMVHPLGFISARFEKKNGKLHGSVTLPKGLSGTLLMNGREIRLHPGKQTA